MATPAAVRHLLVSVGCGVLFAGVYLVAVRTAGGQKLDDRAFQLLFSMAPYSTITVLTLFARGIVIVVLAGFVLRAHVSPRDGRPGGQPVAVVFSITGLTAATRHFCGTTY